VLAGTTLLGLAAGVIGAFALLRKRSLMADALSHATLPGIGLAFLAATALGSAGKSLPVLLLGAAVTGVLGVLCVQALLRHTRLREDAAIGIVLSVFFGAGVVVLSAIQKHAGGSAGGLSHFIYGQTAAMRVSDATLMGGIALAAVLAAALLLKEFALVCFNDAFARVDGWPVSLIDLLMMALVVLVTVAGLQAVGLARAAGISGRRSPPCCRGSPRGR
jgi:manganese/zinc/iron transport system permease protein